DRCLPPREEHLRPGAFGAFGFGPHRCIGARLGEAQMALTVATMLRFGSFRLEPGGAPLRVSRFPVLRPKALPVVGVPRARSSPAPSSGRTERNWLGNVRFRPSTCEEPSSLTELRDAVRRANAAGLPVRVGGAGYAWTPLAATDGA